MKHNGVIQRKLELIADRAAKLRSRLPLDAAQIASDYFLKSAIERTLQVCIEAVVDVANRLLCLADQPAASDSYAALVRLQDLGFIKDASRYRDMVRFRNLVVHRYEDIDPAVLAHVLADHLVDLDQFVQEVQAHA